jgi:hypothetical protein
MTPFPSTVIHGKDLRLDMRFCATDAEVKVQGEAGWRPSGTFAQYALGRIAKVYIPLSLLGLLTGENFLVR